MSVVDSHPCHITAKFGVFVDEIVASFLLRYIGYLSFINDHIGPFFLLILVHVLPPSCLYFWLLA